MYKDSTESRPDSVVVPNALESRFSPAYSASAKQVYDADAFYSVQMPRREPGYLTPLSFMQQQIWLLSQLIPRIPVYNETMMIHLPGRLVVPLFERSLNEIIQRHALWRTSFPLVQGQPVQMIHSAWQVVLAVVDVPALSVKEGEEQVLQLATELALSPFDLTTQPLLRAQLFRLDEENYYFCLVMHQSIFDVQTLYQVFLPELQTLYQAFVHGEPSPLPPLSFEYADFAAWQQEQLRSNALVEQLEYWKRQLANAPAVLELPADRPAPPTPSYRGSRLPFTLSEEVTDGLRLLSQREGVPLDTLLIATILMLLHRYTGQYDVMLGQTNQKNPGFQGLLGVFLTTLLLRVNMGDNPTFHELLERVKEVSLAAHANQDVPFHMLTHALDAEHNGRQFPVQVVFALEPALPTLPDGWTITWPDIAVDVATSDLFFIMRDQRDGLTGCFGYNTDIFDASTVQRMFQHWEVLLSGIVRDQTLHLSELPILTKEEYQQLVLEWNNTQRPYPDDRLSLIHI